MQVFGWILWGVILEQDRNTIYMFRRLEHWGILHFSQFWSLTSESRLSAKLVIHGSWSGKKTRQNLPCGKCCLCTVVLHFTLKSAEGLWICLSQMFINGLMKRVEGLRVSLHQGPEDYVQVHLFKRDNARFHLQVDGEKHVACINNKEVLTRTLKHK